MDSNQITGRIVGALFLFIFISGIIIFQFLQGPVLFSEDYMAITATNSSRIIISVLLGILNGILSILIAIILFPVFKRYSHTLALLYVAFCILSFITIMIDNVSVVSMLELSREYVKAGNSNTLQALGTLAFEKHWWTHYFYLLISCMPVFVLYYTLYLSKLVPRIISVFGIGAVFLMFMEEVFSIFGHSISMDMLLPMALIQFIFPLWLVFKGLNLDREE